MLASRLITQIQFNFTSALVAHRFTEDIYQMTGIRPGLYWQWTWRYIGPVIMIAILISSVVCMIIETPSYNAYNKETVSGCRRRALVAAAGSTASTTNAVGASDGGSAFIVHGAQCNAMNA